ncbi:heparinase II/III family protein [bacterium]|nr:heparinase II/III family protein [bacterium]
MRIAPKSGLAVTGAVAIGLALLMATTGVAAQEPNTVLRPADNPLVKAGAKVAVPTITWERLSVRQDHPRLLFNKDTRPAFREWFANHPAGKAIGKAAKHPQHPDPLAMALLYQMTGQESMARGAIRQLLDGKMAHMNGYLYDWTYEAMSDSERKQATRLLVSQVRVDRASGWPRVSPYASYPEDPRPSETRPDQWRRFYNWTFHDQDWARRYIQFGYFDRVIALAHHAPRMEESVRNFWEYSIKDATIFYDHLKDGSYYQGEYWTRHNRIEQIIRILRNIKSATGVDYLDPKKHPYLANFGRWLLYCSDPTEKRFIWRYGTSYLTDLRIPRPVLLATNWLARDPHVAWLTHETNPRPGQWLDELLYFDRSVVAKVPTDLPGGRAFPGNGLAVMRSGWGVDDPVVMLQFADWWDCHQHMDAGSFLIYCRSPLAPDSGKGCPSTAQFHYNYSNRTIAHNTLTVRDPAEKLPLNDGSQLGQVARTRSFAIGRSAWLYNQEKFDRGELLAFETQKLYDYCAGDATAAYRKDMLKEFVRQAVYLRDGVFVLFDRVETPKPSLEKRWLMHLPDKPKINGRLTKTEVKGHIENYDGNLTVARGTRGAVLRCHTLLPAKPRIRMVGGAIPDVPPTSLVRVSRTRHRMGTGDHWDWTDPLILYYNDPLTGKPQPAIAIERNSPTEVVYEVTDSEIYVKMDAYERGLVQEARMKFADYDSLLDLCREMNLRHLTWHCFVHYLPGYQFYNQGINYTPAYDTHEWGTLSTAAPDVMGKPTDIGSWRIEVYPTQNATRDYFLHAMRILPEAGGEAGNFSARETADRAEATVKLLGKTYVISFAKTGKVGGHIRITDAAGKVLADRDLADKIVQKP